MVAELKKAKKHDKSSAAAFAKKHSLTLASVVSKIKYLDLPYSAEPKKQKAATTELSKADLVEAIRQATGLSKSNAAQLQRSNRETLQILYNNLN